MAVCFSKSVGELFLTDFVVALSAGKQKVETRGVATEKNSEFQSGKSKVIFVVHGSVG